MAEITTTQAFSDGDTVTATKLNNITANAAIQTEAITNRSAETTVDQANDLLLMYDASATALKKISLSNVIKAGTASNFPVTGNATVGGTLAVTGEITASSTVNGTTIPTSKTLVTTNDTQTLTGKTVNLASNTLAGTLAQFNTSCSDADFASLAGSETLSNKTLTSPSINTGTISGGTINNAVIGGTTAAAGSFTTLSATSPITTQAGTAAAPAIVPTGDSNTGLFFPAADTIAFSEGGTEAMRIDSNGNVGIGKSSPTSRLNVVESGGVAARFERGTSGNNVDLNFFNNTGSTGDVARIRMDGDNLSNEYGALSFWTTTTPNSLTERLRIDSSGNVGIGVSSLSDKFTVRGTTGVSTTIDMSSGISTGTEYGSLKFTASSPNFTGAEIRGIHTNGGTNLGVLAFHTSATERLRIDSSGNVGIGTNSPSTPSGKCLTIYDSNIPRLNLKNSTSGDTSTDGVELYINGSDSVLNNRENGSVAIGTNNATRLLIDSSGNVGIGTTSPSDILHVSKANGVSIFESTGVSSVGIRLRTNSTDRWQIGCPSASADLAIYTGAAATERLRITSGGDVLVGTTSAGLGNNLATTIEASAFDNARITINHSNGGSSNGSYFMQFGYGGSRIGSITQATTVGVAYNTSSDYRLKTNLEPISNGIDRIKQLPVYRFNWIADESGNKVDGFVAHEVASIVPEAIHGTKDEIDSDGNPVYQGIDQSKIVPLLTAALKEAIAKIETLEAKVTALEAA